MTNMFVWLALVWFVALRGAAGIICALMAKARNRNAVATTFAVQCFMSPPKLTMFGTPSNLTFWTCVSACWNPSPHSSR
jgi:hypothetical protein